MALKKNILKIYSAVIFNAILWGHGVAQITINRDDLFKTGTMILIYNVDSFSYSPLQEAQKYGENVTWDLSDILPLVTRQDSVYFVNSSGTPKEQCFPTANIVGKSEDVSYYSYYEIDSLQCIKIEDSYFTDSECTDPEDIIILQFPSTYGSAYNGYADWLETPWPVDSGECDSMNKYFTKDYSSIIDGYGTLMIPYGTFTCIRQKITEEINEKTFCYKSGAWIMTDQKHIITYINYSWWGKSINYPLLHIRSYWASMQGYDASGYFISPYPLGLKPAIKTESATLPPLLFPNPANDNISISAVPENASKIIIYNVMGKKIQENRVTAKTISIATHNLLPGLYFVHVIGTDEDILNTGKFCVIK